MVISGLMTHTEIPFKTLIIHHGEHNPIRIVVERVAMLFALPQQIPHFRIYFAKQVFVATMWVSNFFLSAAVFVCYFSVLSAVLVALGQIELRRIFLTVLFLLAARAHIPQNA